MGEGWAPEVGDRVRVVLEGKAAALPGVAGPDDHDLFIEAGNDVHVVDVRHVVSIEKVEAPVEVFQPGDTVRNLTTGVLYTIAFGEMYYNHSRRRVYSMGGLPFTSENHERVTLVEPPI